MVSIAYKGLFLFCLHSKSFGVRNKFFQLFFCLRKKRKCKNSDKTSTTERIKQYKFEFIEYLLNISSSFSCSFLNYLVLLSPFYSVLSCICVYIVQSTQNSENMRRPHEGKRKCKCWLWNWHFSDLFLSFTFFIFFSFCSFIRSFETICLHIVVRLSLSIAILFRIESKIVYSSGQQQHVHSILKYIDIGIHRCI